MKSNLKYNFIKNSIFIFISLLIGVAVVPFLPGEPEPGTLPRALLIVVFGAVFISLHAIDWYRTSDQITDINS